jgi:prenyltransferase beta subunit
MASYVAASASSGGASGGVSAVAGSENAVEAVETANHAMNDRDCRFHYRKHVDYIKVISSDKESFEYVVTEHLRMSGVYWGLTAMAILGKDLVTEMDSPTIVDWVMQCYNPEVGGLVFVHRKFIILFTEAYAGLGVT